MTKIERLYTFTRGASETPSWGNPYAKCSPADWQKIEQAAEVAGVSWTPIPDFHGHGKEDHIYPGDQLVVWRHDWVSSVRSHDVLVSGTTDQFTRFEGALLAIFAKRKKAA